MLGEHVSRILRPEVNTSTVSSSCHAEQHPVAAGRLTQPVDLLAQRQQLLAGFFEGFHQLGVSRGKRVDPRLELVHIAGAAGTARAGRPRSPVARAVAAASRRSCSSSAASSLDMLVSGAIRKLQNALTHSCCAPLPHRKLVQ